MAYLHQIRCNQVEVHLDRTTTSSSPTPQTKTTMGNDRHSRTGHSSRLPGSPSGIVMLSSSRTGSAPTSSATYSPPPRCPITYATVATSFVWMSYTGTERHIRGTRHSGGLPDTAVFRAWQRSDSAGRSPRLDTAARPGRTRGLIDRRNFLVRRPTPWADHSRPAGRACGHVGRYLRRVPSARRGRSGILATLVLLSSSRRPSTPATPGWPSCNRCLRSPRRLAIITIAAELVPA